MTPDATLVVRYDDTARAAVEQTLRKLVRKQGAALVALSVLWGIITLVPLIAASTAVDGNALPFILVSILLVSIPVALGALGSRQLRRQPRLSKIAVTITPWTVLFPAIVRPSALAPRIRAEEWPREATSVTLIPASGLHASRIEFTRQDAGKRRKRSIAVGSIDVDPQVIVDAFRGPTSA
ncbi:hypothetical protein [Microbacterium sp. RG1]|uniref:hypothetical protein n=1 Tax=Microbacterium sp. RG1 TaxID=2489212 RepID=UPI0010CA3D82|nr:hypothetical protein [Microbacterium sp. RG1]QCQ16452.1 hypothetical protein EHF32_06760 [Microbacterium sp. RG1]